MTTNPPPLSVDQLPPAAAALAPTPRAAFWCACRDAGAAHLVCAGTSLISTGLGGLGGLFTAAVHSNALTILTPPTLALATFVWRERGIARRGAHNSPNARRARLIGAGAGVLAAWALSATLHAYAPPSAMLYYARASDDTRATLKNLAGDMGLGRNALGAFQYIEQTGLCQAPSRP